MKENWSKKEGSIIAGRGKAARIVERFMSNAQNAPRLLDVGSGQGIFLETLPAYFKVDVADYADFLSANAKKRAVSFTALDLNGAWPFEDASYDAVTAWNVLEHLENPFHFAREAARVLRPGGLLFVSIPNILNWRNRFFFLRTGDMVRYHRKNSHLTPFTRTTLHRIFSSFTIRHCGFTGYEFPFFSKKTGGTLFKYFLKSREGFGQTLYMVLQKPQ